MDSSSDLASVCLGQLMCNDCGQIWDESPCPVSPCPGITSLWLPAPRNPHTHQRGRLERRERQWRPVTPETGTRDHTPASVLRPLTSQVKHGSECKKTLYRQREGILIKFLLEWWWPWRDCGTPRTRPPWCPPCPSSSPAQTRRSSTRPSLSMITGVVSITATPPGAPPPPPPPPRHPPPPRCPPPQCPRRTWPTSTTTTPTTGSASTAAPATRRSGAETPMVRKIYLFDSPPSLLITFNVQEIIYVTRVVCTTRWMAAAARSSDTAPGPGARGGRGGSSSPAPTAPPPTPRSGGGTRSDFVALIIHTTLQIIFSILDFL